MSPEPGGLCLARALGANEHGAPAVCKPHGRVLASGAFDAYQSVDQCIFPGGQPRTMAMPGVDRLDSRERERKKFGLKGARKQRQFTKR